jgi:hypothetical protein
MPSPRGKKITLPEQSSRIQSAPLTPLPYQSKIDGGNKTATKISRKAKPLPRLINPTILSPHFFITKALSPEKKKNIKVLHRQQIYPSLSPQIRETNDT